MRGTARAAELIAQGFLVSHQMSAAKIEAVLDAIDRGRDRFVRGSLLWGNIDTYLAWRLSGGAIYAMDHGQACATGYYDYFTGAWNTALIEAQGLERQAITRAERNDAPLRRYRGRRIRRDVSDHAHSSPISRAPRIAEGCLNPGDAKATFGTSATLDVNTGIELKIANGTYPMVLWTRDGVRSFCIEGMVNTAGAMIDWAVAELGLAASAAELSRTRRRRSPTAARRVRAAGAAGTRRAARRRVAPRRDRRTFARDDTRPHRARGARRHRVSLARSARRQRLPRARSPDALRVDGGASRSDALMQIQADVLGTAGRAARGRGSNRARRRHRCRRRQRDSGRPITARHYGA